MNVAGNSGFVLFNRTLNVALVEVDDPNSLGHELIHLLGQEIDFYSDRSLLEVPPGVHWDGTGVNARTMQILSDKLPIMSGLSGNLADYWIDRNSYYKAFNTLIRPEVDPQIIILSGLIGKNGTLTSTRVVQSGSGLLTSNVEAGEILVKTLSASGATLNQVRVNLDYLISASGNKSTGPMVYELEAAPIVVSLPNSATVAKIQVSKGNSILYEHQMSAPTPTAAEIVSRIPIDGMNGKLQLHRQAQRALLLKTAKTINSLLTKQQYKSAIVLLSVLKLEINLMVKRTYPVNGQEITRSQAIELIESMTRYYTTRK